MRKLRALNKNRSALVRFCTLLLSLCLGKSYTNAQVCPPNIDFESGTFNNWKCLIGGTAAIDNQNVISLFETSPVPGRHTMYKASDATGELDQFGGFPVNCPNGSGYSIRLGNDQPGTQAEGISYEFTIPVNMDMYSLIYHYAVVFQDPNHLEHQQPRMEIEIMNVTDNIRIDCSSFTFIPFGSSLPGFFESSVRVDDTPIWCKDWSAVSINLDGHAGKTIRLSFKTADCTFRRHFGYAYIDVNSECTSEFVGATFCPDDTAINVTAPYGYQGYTWYDQTFSSILGTQQSIRFSPPPAVGTTIAVELVPFNGYGCIDTLYARLLDTLTVRAVAGKDTLSCNGSPVMIGSNLKPGLVYSWSPVTGLSNPNISNPLASPTITTEYIVTTRNYGGGCMTTDTVIVRASIIDNSIQLIGKATFCEGNGDSAILRVLPHPKIEWYKDDALIPGADKIDYRVLRSGNYHAVLFNSEGCKLATIKQKIIIEKPRGGITYPVEYAVVALPLELNARDFGATVTWSPATNLNNPHSFKPVFEGSTDQFYTIEIITASGCVTVDNQLVKVIPFVEIYVPTAFTPNNDGLNDFLKPNLRGIKDLRYFRVFNRWGQLVYESRTEQPGWDGTIGGILQSTGVYIWMAEGMGVDKRLYKRKGTSALLR